MSYSSETPFLEMLFTLIGSCPLMIIYLVGIVLALTRWSRNPRPALLTLLAFAGFLLLHVLGALFFAFGLPAIMNSTNMGYEAFRVTVAGVRFVWNIGEAILYGLLIAAIFMGRKDDSKAIGRYPDEEGSDGPEPPGPKDTSIQENRPGRA